MNTIEATPVRIAAHSALIKRLGHWTTEREFEVRAHRGAVVLDLRSPRIPDGDLHLALDLDHAMVKLLLPEDAVLDDWDLRREGRSKVKDAAGRDTEGGRRVVLTGTLRTGEVRVHRGGIAILSAMCSRAYLDDLRRVHREGGLPIVDDPTRTA
ncbi:MAG TPA: hypothetical protein VG756_13740 [Pseudonocardiaceae bacterium]|jgi:hypothetical protein|nr:hypothetical protein [Pseudonocardiaceae bacterium]